MRPKEGGMTTIYIAGPMTGLPDFNYPAFDAAEVALRTAGFEVLNPTSSEAENTTGAPREWDWYMRRALRMVIAADAIAVLDGWWRSRGATLEVHVAQNLCMDIESVDSWLSQAVTA
jgi:nucleoside 2-deoxyribosyltransferase